MITNEEKINLVIAGLVNIEGSINSFISHAEEFKDKYSLEHELFICNAKKDALISVLNDLGGTWPIPID